MEDQRFDELAKDVGKLVSRRQVLKVVVATIVGGAFVRVGTGAALASNDDCAAFCDAVFSPSSNRGQCKSEGAQGTGLCFTPCGPNGPSGSSGQLCGDTGSYVGTTCCDAAQCQTCDPNSGTCVGCAAGQTCSGGQCVTVNTSSCDNPFDPVTCTRSSNCAGCLSGGVCSTACGTCYPIVGGGGFCAPVQQDCTTLQTCNTTADCAPGTTCVGTCCGYPDTVINKCVAPCGVTVPANLASVSPLAILSDQRNWSSPVAGPSG